MPYKTGSWGDKAKARSLKRVKEGYWKTSKNIEYKKGYNQKKKEEVYNLLGRKCVKCGFSDMRALQIDHINDDGYKDRWVGASHTSRYLRVLRDIKNYQVLCANCNWIKRYERSDK